jgi:hypothetical protein
MKIKNHHKPDASKHIQEQKSGAGKRNDPNSAKIDKATDKALHQRDSSANLAKVAPSPRNR